jgi:proteasome lid subunit RPN8/RPN11
MTTSIVGTVHSHPGGSTRHSEADRHLFSKFGFVHAIIGEPYNNGKIAFYDKNGARLQVQIL